MTMLRMAVCAATVAIGLSASVASAAVVRVSEADFKPTAGLITFSEVGFPLGTINPTYTPANYGGGVGAPTVTMGGWFLGQSLSLTPGVDCVGAAASACVVGSPSGPLTLDANSPNVFITGDGSNPTSPVLSGTPTFDGPIALLFDTDQFGVGFDGGFFNAIGSTGITAFARDGSLLGTVVNTSLGIEFLGLVTSDGVAQIAGVFLDLVGAEPAGFAIDNVRFGQPGDIVVPPIPLPAAGWLLISGIGGFGVLARRRRAVAQAA